MKDNFCLFLHNLKTVLNTVKLYSATHSIFIQKLEEFYLFIRDMFKELDSITISISKEEILINGEYSCDITAYADIVEALYARRIVLLEVRSGLFKEELAAFLELLSTPVKTLNENGGIRKLLRDRGVASIVVKEIDFKKMLLSNGEDAFDPWEWIVSQDIDTDISENKLLDDAFSADGLRQLKNDKAKFNKIKDYFLELKKGNSESYKKYAKKAIKGIVESSGEGFDAEAVSPFVEGLSADEIADTLWEEIMSQDGYDTLNIGLFARLIGDDKSKDVAAELEKRAKRYSAMLNSPNVRKKIKQLFSGAEETISKSYYNFLSGIIDNLDDSGAEFFNERHAFVNFLYIMIEMLDDIKGDEKKREVLLKIYGYWNEYLTFKDTELFIKLYLFISDYLSGLNNNIGNKEMEQLEDIRSDISREFENMVLNGDIPDKYFQDVMPIIANNKTIKNKFFQRILLSRKLCRGTTAFILYSYGSEEWRYILRNIKKRMKDRFFIKSLVESVTLFNPSGAFFLLKFIYENVEPEMKSEVLSKMEELKIFNEEFIDGVIKDDDDDVVLTAFKIALLDKRYFENKMAGMFKKDIFFFFKKKKMLRYAAILEKAGISEARYYYENIISDYCG